MGLPEFERLYYYYILFNRNYFTALRQRKLCLKAYCLQSVKKQLERLQYDLQM
jgi:hypothetical protein